MTWVSDQMQQGRLRVEQPKGARDAFMPLDPDKRYRTFWNPKQAHYCVPDTDYSFCGLGLAPPEDPDFLINSGWDEVAWFIEAGVDDKTCKLCSDKRSKWRVPPTRSLPTDSPVTAGEWAATLGPKAELERRKWARLIHMVEAELDVEVVE